MSADGRFVAFESLAADLVADDANGDFDVFVRDLKTGTTTLVSANRAGTGSGNGFSFAPAISADGRFVAFESFATDLVADDDANGDFDVFVRDLKTGTTTLISVNRAGCGSGNGFSSAPAISADGRLVAFVSANDAGTSSGNSQSRFPVFSADGRSVAFDSLAGDLVANDTNFNSDVFVRDLHTGTTTLVSVNSAGTDSGNNGSGLAAVSANARFVAFVSSASDLAGNDTNFNSDVFVRDLKTGTTTLVSVNSAGTDSGNGFSIDAAISDDGRFVAFGSYAGDLVANDTNGGGDVFVRDLKTGTTTLVSVNRAGTDSGNGFSIAAAISADGRLVAFFSEASDLIAGDTNHDVATDAL
ncbi:MAG: hypothetical protein DMG10_26205 [Acidobacteria bacterium]|nr:MAG: hypothetical protein DMG10_26205 [Acidobacteriota bacterium]